MNDPLDPKVGNPEGSSNPVSAAAAARNRAAALLVSAAHLLDDAPGSVDGAAQVACLAAADALDAAPMQSELAAVQGSSARSAQGQIRAALAALGGLPAAAFADPRVHDGARYARLALRRLT